MAEKLSSANTVRVKQLTPVIGVSAYGAGDLIGSAAMEFKKALGVGHKERGGLIQQVTIIDLAAQAADLDVVFFDTEPDTTTFTDNAAFAPADADLDYLIGYASVTTWNSFSANAIGQATGLNMPFVLEEQDASLWAALVSQGTPTYSATSDLIIKVSILPLL